MVLDYEWDLTTVLRRSHLDLCATRPTTRSACSLEALYALEALVMLDDLRSKHLSNNCSATLESFQEYECMLMCGVRFLGFKKQINTRVLP